MPRTMHIGAELQQAKIILASILQELTTFALNEIPHDLIAVVNTAADTVQHGYDMACEAGLDEEDNND